jgi:hypothetical protein
MQYLRRTLLLSCFLLISVGLKAQNVKLSYQNQPLSTILTDLEQRYQLSFSYAKDRLNLNRRMSFYVNNQSLDKSLEQFFKNNNIQFAKFGEQYVLKNAKTPQKISKAPEKTSTQTQPKEIPMIEVTKVEPPKEKEIIVEATPEVQERELSRKTIQPVQLASITIDAQRPTAVERTVMQRFRSDVREVWGSWQSRKKSGEIRVFQLSTLGTRRKWSDKTNILALSLGWGVHGSLEGAQASILGTAIRRDANGLQIAGLFNGVGGDVMGLQAAGLMNVNRGNLMGLQIGGIFNRSQKTIGGQISLGLNWSDQDLMGLQIAGLGNVAKASANSAQIASIFNITDEKSNFQLSSLYNKAQHLQGAQISLGTNEAERVDGVQIGAVNRARRVKGLQLGIINMADSVSGVSFGLFNLIRNGYNKLEIGSMESVHVLMSLKMGPRSLYHIYQGGFHLWGRAWGIGGGLGSVIPLRHKKWDFNIEATAMHINEDKKWTPQLNLMTQLRTSFEYKIDKDFSLFLGPSINFMMSRYRHPETGALGSTLPVYALVDQSTNRTNYRGWLGFYSGVRMSLW